MIATSIRSDSAAPAAAPRDFFEPTLRGYLKDLFFSVVIVSLWTTARVVLQYPVPPEDVLVPIVMFACGNAAACFVPFIRRPLNAMFR